MSQGSPDLKIRFLGQKVCSVARVHTDRQTDRQTDTKVNTEDNLSGFQEFFLQPIIRDRSNTSTKQMAVCRHVDSLCTHILHQPVLSSAVVQQKRLRLWFPILQSLQFLFISHVYCFWAFHFESIACVLLVLSQCNFKMIKMFKNSTITEIFTWCLQLKIWCYIELNL